MLLHILHKMLGQTQKTSHIITDDADIKTFGGFSFQNIDKFSSASLVTRMTTDITHVQMSYMMVIRIAVRSPMMLIFSVIMAYIMGGALSATFVVVIPVLIFGLVMIARKAMPAFRRVFKKYKQIYFCFF